VALVVDDGRPADAALGHGLGRRLHRVLRLEGENVGSHHVSNGRLAGHWRSTPLKVRTARREAGRAGHPTPARGASLNGPPFRGPTRRRPPPAGRRGPGRGRHRSRPTTRPPSPPWPDERRPWR